MASSSIFIQSFSTILLGGMLLISCEKENECYQEEHNVTAKVSEAFSFKGLKFHQSMAFYGENALFITPEQQKLVCDIYNLNTKEWLTNIELTHDGYKCPHANVTCLGNSYYSPNSLCPTLYVSSWDNGRQCFVYDITKEEGTYRSKLIQIIDPSNVSEEIIGGGYLDWVVDRDNANVYALAYHLKNTSMESKNNYTHVTKFKLPDYRKDLVVFEDSDVLESYTVPVMTVFQDKDYDKGHIYIAAGINNANCLYPPRLFDIDLRTKQMKENNVPLSGEPEGFVVYKGEKLMNIGSTEIIYTIN